MAKSNVDEPNLFSLRCEQCGQVMIRTVSGYLACAKGHGRLVVESTDDRDENDQFQFGQ